MNLKRALVVGMVAASIVLGTAVPAAFATTSTVGGRKVVSVNGTVVSEPYTRVALDSGNETSYIGVWYLGQAVRSAGGNYSWDATNKVFNLTIPGVDPSKISIPGGVGFGNTTIQVNGTTVKKFNSFAAQDPASGTVDITTFVPLFYIGEVFNAVGGGASWNGNTFAFKTFATTYTTKWTGYVGNVGSNPVIAGNTVVTADADSNGAIYGYDAATGQKLWEFDQNTYYQGYLVGSPQAVLVSKDNNTVMAFSPTTGQPIWSTPSSISGLIDYTVVNGQADIVSDGNQVSALDATTGAVLWQKTVSGVTYTAVHANDGQIAVGTTTGHLVAFATNGTQLFNKTLPNATPVTDIATDGSNWFVTQGQRVTGVSPSGVVLWSHTFAKNVSGGTVAVDAGKIFAATDDGVLNTLSASTGQVEQTITLPFSTFTMPVVANGRIYIATNEGLLSVLDETTLKPISSVSQYTDPGNETLSCWFAPLIYGSEVIVETHNPGFSGDAKLVALVY